ncbi:MAG: cobalamin B12-binding domain-containing protein [Candidatus Aenigmarchaeota archaeon]|nr:cobalamin B12-binding domain-containing protein [Candidatus Aenigmarchaeota archaeon]
MKILLIKPPLDLFDFEVASIVPPLGLAYIAGFLEKNDYNVKILDTVVEDTEPKHIKDNLYHWGLSYEKINEFILKEKPDVVGIGCLFSSQFRNSMVVAKHAKEAGCIVVVGGTHASANPEELLKSGYIDYVVLGEGEETVLELMKSIENKEELRSNSSKSRIGKYHNKYTFLNNKKSISDSAICKIDGLAYKYRGKIHVNQKTKYIKNIDTIPMPARHLLPMKKYLDLGSGHGPSVMRTPCTSVITSRGCPFNCVFCSTHNVWGKTWRGRDAKKVVDEVEEIVKTYGVKEVHFDDDNISLDRERMEQICNEIIKRGLKIKWCTPNGIALWTLDEALLRLMKKSGCYKLSFGLESGDKETLKFIRKPLQNLGIVKEKVALVNSAGIWTQGFFIIGFPYESLSSVQNTVNFAVDVDLDFASFEIAAPLPGTDLYRIMRKENMVNEIDWEDIRLRHVEMKTKHFTTKELVKLQKQVYLGFFKRRLFGYLNPIKTFKRLRRIDSLDSLKFIAKIAKRVYYNAVVRGVE